MFINKKEFNNRIYGLDMLRSIAILFVLIAHTTTFVTGKVSHPLTITGFYGVEFFFVLSGFLIGTILIKIHHKEPNTSIKSIKAFWIRRWFRTLPNYYLMLFIYMALYFVTKHVLLVLDINYLAYFVFLQNTFSPQPDFYNISWSLSIEEWFYLIFPILLFSYQGFQKNKRKSVVYTVATIILFCLVGRIIIALNQKELDWDGWFRKLMPLRLDGIAFGVLAAYLKFYYQSIWVKYKSLFACIGILLLSIVFVVVYNDVVLNTNSLNISFFSKTFLFTINSLAVALLLPFVYDIKTNSRYLTYLVTIISLISYSIYLVHPLVIGILSKLGLKNALGVILLWVITIIISYFQYSLFESRITKIRDRLTDKSNSINVLS
ncbi:acyltransferase family protein [Mucilaginibacter terrae]|uniref:acyltransferase family protein n=1 Tax=Mucilaginibacter terrae TaxID=1955052 RepID=UPI0036328BC1